MQVHNKRTLGAYNRRRFEERKWGMDAPVSQKAKRKRNYKPTKNSDNVKEPIVDPATRYTLVKKGRNE